MAKKDGSREPRKRISPRRTYNEGNTEANNNKNDKRDQNNRETCKKEKEFLKQLKEPSFTKKEARKSVSNQLQKQSSIVHAS